MSLAQRLLKLSEHLTYLLRRDDMACPPVPPHRFHLCHVNYRLVEIVRSLERQNCIMYSYPHKTLPERIYAQVKMIHSALLGKPPHRSRDLVHASEYLLRVLCGALERAFNAVEASKPTM